MSNIIGKKLPGWLNVPEDWLYVSPRVKNNGENLKDTKELIDNYVKPEFNNQNLVRIQSIELNQKLVYFVSDRRAHIKIGITNNLEVRIRTMQIGCAYPLVAVATSNFMCTKQAHFLEDELHKKYSEYNIHGEWFNFTGALAGEIIYGVESGKYILAHGIRDINQLIKYHIKVNDGSLFSIE